MSAASPVLAAENVADMDEVPVLVTEGAFGSSGAWIARTVVMRVAVAVAPTSSVTVTVNVTSCWLAVLAGVVHWTDHVPAPLFCVTAPSVPRVAATVTVAVALPSGSEKVPEITRIKLPSTTPGRALKVTVGGAFDEVTMLRLAVSVRPRSSVAVTVRVAVCWFVVVPGATQVADHVPAPLFFATLEIVPRVAATVTVTVALPSGSLNVPPIVWVVPPSTGLVGALNVTVGAVLALIVTLRLAVSVRPRSSVAVTVNVAVCWLAVVPGATQVADHVPAPLFFATLEIVPREAATVTVTVALPLGSEKLPRIVCVSPPSTGLVGALNVTVGAALALIVMLRLAVAARPPSSVAVTVRVAVCCAPVRAGPVQVADQVPAPLFCAYVGNGAARSRNRDRDGSVAVRIGEVAPDCLRIAAVYRAGRSVERDGGAALALIVMLRLAVAARPPSSVAVTVRVAVCCAPVRAGPVQVADQVTAP